MALKINKLLLFFTVFFAISTTILGLKLYDNKQIDVKVTENAILKFANAVNILKSTYNDLDVDTLVNNSINTMVNSIDGYNKYVSSETINKVLQKNITYNLENNVLYLKINQFLPTTVEQSLKIIEDFHKGHKFNGLILDLRDNQGGLLQQGISFAELFLDSSPILNKVDNKYKTSTIYTAKKGDIINNAPLIVLINKNSASTSELVAGTLQSGKRAIVIGEQSYGKGTFQQKILLGNNGESLYLTKGALYLPNGKPINNVGITPTIQSDEKTTLKRAYSLINQYNEFIKK